MKWLMIAALVVEPVWGQEPGTDPRVHRLVNLKYADPIAARTRPHDAHCDAESDEEDREKRVDGDAEDLLHRLGDQEAFHVGEGDLVALSSRR